ncbi:MAG: HU family DNA-binding protein [Parabacteroides sp.]
MNSKELIAELSKQLGWTTKEVTDTLSAMSNVIGAKLIENDSVSLQGFGQFEVKRRAERITVNPTTRKRYLVPPKLVPVFRPGVMIKNQLKGESDHE